MGNEFNDIKEFESREDRVNKYNYRHKRDYQNEKKLMYLWIALGVLTIILIIALVVTNSESYGNGGKKVEDSRKEEVYKPSKIEDNKDNTAENGGKSMLQPLSQEHEVFKLVLEYIDVAYVKCDSSALEGIVDSLENVSVEQNNVRQRYIESYNDINVYLLDGNDNTNVVFVAYNAKLYNYDTLLPSGETFKVIKNEEGRYYIHNIEVGEKFENQMVNKAQVEEMAELQEKIQSEYNAVIESNSEIKSIVDILNATKNN